MMAKSTMKFARISRRLRCIDIQYLVWPANIELSKEKETTNQVNLLLSFS
jgi:hypothetical protein